MMRRDASASERQGRGIVIVGSGISGIAMAVRLRQRGVDDFVILERAHELGGTWRDNSYPGCACDVQSTLYSYSFAPNPDWSRVFAPQGEIQEYLRQVATTHDLARHFVFGATVTGARWHSDERTWTVSTTTGDWRAPILVLASGPLSDPVIPTLPGLAQFRGHVFHSARWDHDHPLDGRRVAVVGTGASAIQLIPRVQKRARQLTVVQRTPPWIMPRGDRAIGAWRRSLYRALPVAQRLARAATYAFREAMIVPFRHPRLMRVVALRARRLLRAQVRDPVLRDRLTPHYTLGCKRILLSDDYYPALVQSNVELVTDAIAGFTPDAMQTAAGRTIPVDTVIFATGFRPTDPPLAPVILGRDGTSLAQAWRGSPKAYMGTTMVGFPNLFFLLGPNTGLGHSSLVPLIEAQVAHVLGVLDLMHAAGADTVEPRAEAQAAYVEWIDAALESTVWNSGGCRSWYLDGSGRNAALWPFRVGRFTRTVARPRAGDYVFELDVLDARSAPVG